MSARAHDAISSTVVWTLAVLLAALGPSGSMTCGAPIGALTHSTVGKRGPGLGEDVFNTDRDQ